MSPRIARAAREMLREMRAAAPRAFLLCVGVMIVVIVAVDDLPRLLMLQAGLASALAATALVGLEAFVCGLLSPSGASDATAPR